MSLEALLGVSEAAADGGPVFEAGHLDQVEVDVAHELRSGGVGGLEAAEQHVVADAVRLAVERVVGEIVAAREGPHFGGAQVVRAAAAVEPPRRAQIVVVRRDVACAAPFCTWNK